MPGTNELKVGLIGFGLAGSVFHGPLIDACPGLALTAIVTSNPERSRLALAQYPGVRVYERPGLLWESAGELDLVVIASPNRTHMPLALAALEAGLPVVVDKPLAASPADARVLVAEACRRQRLLTVFHNRRWDSDFLTLSRLLRENALGEPKRFESRFERWRPEPKPGWRQQGAPENAGGVLYDLGSHLIDQALVLFGPVDSVYAELDQRYPGAEVDDDSFVALTHTSGMRSHLWMSSVAAHAGPRMRLLGSEGAFVSLGLDGQENALREGSRPDLPDWPEASRGGKGWIVVGAEERSLEAETGAYLRFYEAVTDALHNNGPAPVDPLDAVAGLDIVAAALRASREGRVVQLDRD